MAIRSLLKASLINLKTTSLNWINCSMNTKSNIVLIKNAPSYLIKQQRLKVDSVYFAWKTIMLNVFLNFANVSI